MPSHPSSKDHVFYRSLSKRYTFRLPHFAALLFTYFYGSVPRQNSGRVFRSFPKDSGFFLFEWSYSINNQDVSAAPHIPPQSEISALPPKPAQSGRNRSLLRAIGTTIAGGMAFVTGSVLAYKIGDAISRPQTIQERTVVREATTEPDIFDEHGAS